MTPPATAAARSGAVVDPRVRRAPVRHPRRVSGPARSARPQRPARRRTAIEAPGIALRAIDAVNSASQSPLLDRLIRSRTWIGLLAFSLIGIVAMQLLVLELNTDVGRLLARAATLQRQNTLTRIEGSRESAGALVEPTAAAAGMTMAAPGSLHFVTVSRSDIARAATALQAPVSTAVPAEASAASQTSAASQATPASESLPSVGASSSAEAPGG